MKIAVVSENEYLYQKIRILLRNEFSAELVRGAVSNRYDLCIWDTDTAPRPYAERIISIGRSGADVPYPVSFEKLVEAVKRVGKPDKALLTLGDECVFLRGERISLTEVEYALISVLFKSRGKFISREDLISAVWGDSVSGGVLNVYIHYLRQKLETGEKIIISSRGEGYKINEKYL